MAVALRGPDAESWLTDVQMIDSASVRIGNVANHDIAEEGLDKIIECDRSR